MSRSESGGLAVILIAVVLLGFVVVCLAGGGLAAFWLMQVNTVYTEVSPPTVSSPVYPGDTLSVVKEITAAQMGLDAAEIQPSTSMADLGADELDIVELVMELEEEFDVSIPDEAIENVTGSQTWVNGADKLTMEKLAEIVERQKLATFEH